MQFYQPQNRNPFTISSIKNSCPVKKAQHLQTTRTSACSPTSTTQVWLETPSSIGIRCNGLPEERRTQLPGLATIRGIGNCTLHSGVGQRIDLPEFKKTPSRESTVDSPTKFQITLGIVLALSAVLATLLVWLAIKRVSCCCGARWAARGELSEVAGERDTGAGLVAVGFRRIAPDQAQLRFGQNRLEPLPPRARNNFIEALQT